MTRLGFWVRVVGAGILIVASIVLAVNLGLSANYNASSVDHGVRSALAMVSNQRDDAVAGTLELLNVGPGPGAAGRLTFYIDGGSFTSSGASEPSDPLEPDLSNGADPGAGQNGGFAVVLGGQLASSLISCNDDDGVVISKNVRYTKLSEIERDTIVSNITSQESNRVIAFGIPSSTSTDATPIQIAASMRYTVLQFATLYPDTWSMNVTHPEVSGTGSTSQSVDAVGYHGIARCAYRESSLMTNQGWGVRFEIPPTTVATAPVHPADDTQAEATRDVYRLRDTPDFSYYTQYSFDNSTTLENGGGVFAYEDVADAVRGSSQARATVSVSQGAMGFENINYPQLRDLGIFVAGAAASLAASLLVAILKTIARTMRPFKEDRAERS